MDMEIPFTERDVQKWNKPSHMRVQIWANIPPTRLDTRPKSRHLQVGRGSINGSIKGSNRVSRGSVEPVQGSNENERLFGRFLVIPNFVLPTNQRTRGHLLIEWLSKRL